MFQSTDYCISNILTNWHNVWSYYQYCSPIDNATDSCFNTEDYIVWYVYKQHMHAVRYLNHSPYFWIPSLTYNITPFINPLTGLFIAHNIHQSLALAQPLAAGTVVYPDYSIVNVGQGKVWPKKVFSPYVDSTAWPPYSLTNSYQATSGLYYNLGFIVSRSATVCEPTWGTYYAAGAGPLNEDIKAIRALGGDVTISFGGAANIPLHVTAPDANSLFEQYKRFTLAYGLTRIDFDLEGIWIAQAYNSANSLNSQALKMLQDYYSSINQPLSIWFTLPVLPTGLTVDGLNILQLALNAGVTIGGVNVMTMDYGDSAAPNPQGNMGLYGIQAITALKDQLNTLYNGQKTSAELWAMIGTTPMIGVNDIPNEIFTLSDATQTLNFANTNAIGMISMWSSNRDTTSGSGIPQADYAFAKTFTSYTP